MFTNSIANEATESTSLAADVTDDDSCRLNYIEIVPLTTVTSDTDGPCTTECDGRDWSVRNEETESTSLPADMTDDSCRVEFIEIVPLTRDTDGRCTTECDSGDWSAEVKQENLSVVKQEPDDVCCILATCYLLWLDILMLSIVCSCRFWHRAHLCKFCMLCKPEACPRGLVVIARVCAVLECFFA